MVDLVLFRASITFAIASGAGAAALATISMDGGRSWRRSIVPGFVAIGMLLGTLHHIGVASLGRDPIVLESLLVVGNLLLTTVLVLSLAAWSANDWTGTPDERRFDSRILLVGIVLFAFGAPVVAMLAPPMEHWTHGIAGLIAGVGLYQPAVSASESTGGPPEHRTPGRERPRPAWLGPTDHAILALLASSRLVLSPAIIAVNLDRSRATVNRRLRKLEAADLVERVNRGKYRIATEDDD